MRDSISNVHPVLALAPLATAITDNTAQVSAIIDTLGYQRLAFLIVLGTLADADATFAVTMDHGDAANLSNGTLALAGFTFAADLKCRKVGYLGSKRYVRLTITPSTNTGAAPMAVIALLSTPSVAPTANPPQA